MREHWTFSLVGRVSRSVAALAAVGMVVLGTTAVLSMCFEIAMLLKGSSGIGWLYPQSSDHLFGKLPRLLIRGLIGIAALRVGFRLLEWGVSVNRDWGDHR